MKRPSPRTNQQPHTKRRCHRCHGSGRAPCQICGGAGKVAKRKDVYGNPQFERCDGCFGIKTIRCSTCGGEGFT